MEQIATRYIFLLFYYYDINVLRVHVRKVYTNYDQIFC